MLGTVNDIPALARLTHAAGGVLLVDGAQGICHEPVDVSALDCDYYAFSGHKLGALWYRRPVLRRPLPAVRYGRGMVDQVLDQTTTFGPAPMLWEAAPLTSPGPWDWPGPAIPPKSAGGLAGLGAQPAGTAGAGTCRPGPGRVLGHPRRRSGCLSFTLEGLPFDVAVLLDQLGIAVRSGHHCAQPLLRWLGVEYTLRVSPACYNTPEEIDAFCPG